MRTDDQSGYLKAMADRAEFEIQEDRERFLNGQPEISGRRSTYVLPPLEVKFSAPAEPTWQAMSPEAKAKVRAAMRAWYGAPDEVSFGPGFSKVLEQTLADRDRQFNHPQAPQTYTTPNGQHEMLDKGMTVMRERPPAGVSNGLVSYFDAHSGLPLDPDFARTFSQLTGSKFMPARIDLLNDSWWEQDLDVVRFRGSEVRRLRLGEADPAAPQEVATDA